MTEEGYHDDDEAPLILVGTGIVVTNPVTKNEYRMKDVIGAASSSGTTVYRVDESSDHDEPTTAVAVKILNIKKQKGRQLLGFQVWHSQQQISLSPPQYYWNQSLISHQWS